MASSGGMDPWLVHLLDQTSAGFDEVRAMSRANFEAMVRRNVDDEDGVQTRMAWFDQHRASLDTAFDVASQDPAVPVQATPHEQQPASRSTATDVEPAPEPDIEDEFDDDGGRERGSGKWWDGLEMPPREPAPDKSTRMWRAPAVYWKAFWIGLGIGAAVWLAVTGLLVWLTATPWWGWWPSLLTVTLGALVFLWWFGVVHKDVKNWVRYGGQQPLRRNFKI